MCAIVFFSLLAGMLDLTIYTNVLLCSTSVRTYGGNSPGTTRDYAARARGQVISKVAFVYDSMISYSSIHSATFDRRLL